MPTFRNSSSLSNLMKLKFEEYLKRFGRKFTWISISETKNEDGKVKAITKTETTIYGDLQYDNISKFYDNYGISPEGDGMFFTLSSNNLQLNDEIVDPSNTTTKWKLIKKIENEDVGTGKPYIGFVTQKAP